MLIHAFLSGLGIALAYTVITSIIIDSHEVHSLPFLYVVTSILLLFVGFVYSKLEHKYQPSKLFKGVLLALSIWGVFMFLNFRMGRSFLIISIAFCSYYLVYYLSNLEYWGSASLIFDVRQGKRLFGLLSVGESLAKIMGYALTPLIISSFSESSVFMVVALSFGGAYFIFKKLSKNYHSSMLVSHSDHHHDHKGSGAIITRLKKINSFKNDSFKVYISLFALISTLTYFLIHYAFLVKIEERYVDMEDIAVFIATLYSSAKIANLLIKIFFSGRIFQFMGLKVVLLLLPSLLLAVNLYGVVGILTGQLQETFIVWVFTSIIIIDEVFRTSLYTPAYLTLFQPLTKEKRLEGHTLCKGIMEPIGIGIAGLVILILIKSDQFNLSILSYIILFWLLMWIFAGTRLFKSYLGILQNALKSKLLNRGTLELSKEEIHILINDKLKSNDPLERLYALKMLGDRIPVSIIEKHASQLLNSNNTFIIKNVIDYISELEIDNLADELKTLIDHNDQNVSKKAIYEYGRILKVDCINEFKSLIEYTDINTKDAILGAGIKYGGLTGAIEFGNILMDMISSTIHEQRKRAAMIIGDIQNEGYYQPLADLITDEHRDVQTEAVIAAGKVKNVNLIPILLSHIDQRHLFLHLKRSLSNFRKELASQIKKVIGHKGPAEDIRLIKLISNNDQRHITEIYLEYLKYPLFDVRGEAINALFYRSYHIKNEDDKTFETILDSIENNCNQLIEMHEKEIGSKLKKLIFAELYHIQLPKLYECLSFKYSRKAIIDIIDNTYIAGKEYRSVALELLENTLNSRDSRRVTPIIEKILDIEDEAEGKENITDIEEVIRQVVIDANKNYSSWTLASMIRIATERRIDLSINYSLKTNNIIALKQEIELYLNQIQNQ